MEVELKVDLQFSFSVLDLSGQHAFNIVSEIRQTTHNELPRRSLTILTTNSVFDPEHALENGLLELTDVETDNPVRISAPVTSSAGDENPTLPNALVTLLSDPPGSINLDSPEKHVLTVPFPTKFNSLLRANHTYRLRITSSDLGIQWSHPGTASDFDPHSLPPSAYRTLRSTRPTISRLFSVVASLPSPPVISITLVPTQSLLYKSGTPQTSLLITATLSVSATPITIKTSGEQPCLHAGEGTGKPTTPHTARPTVLSTNPPPDLRNFSLSHANPDAGGAAEEALPDTYACALPAYGGKEAPQGPGRNELLTLHPGVPVERSINISARAPGLVARLVEGEWVLRLRERDVWWCEGTAEELFEHEGRSAEKRLMRWPENYRLRLGVSLACEREVRLTVAE